MHTQNNQLILIKINSLYLLFFSIFLFILVSFFLFLNINTQEFDIEMVIVSIFFFFFLTFILINEQNKFTPIIFFSLLFYGYVFSGLYFSYYQNIHTAKFFNFHGNFTTEDIKESLYQVVCGYMFFVLGYKLSNRIKIKKVNLEIKNINYKSKKLEYILVFLFLISFFYWIFVSYKLAKGPVDLMFNMAQYVLFQSLNPISTTPYIIGYVATYYLFIINLNNENKLKIINYFMIILTFIMYLSTGRLSGSVFYLLSFLLMYLIWNKFKISIKIYIYLLIFVLLLFVLYFYREYTNLNYLGIEMETNIVKLVGTHFFGMTNFGDLQSITFSNQYIKDVKLMFGETFFDMTRFWLNKIPFIELEPTSIGLRLREYYFSHIDTGAPAPGIISEMIINFNFLGITIAMFIFGVITQILRKFIDPNKNVFNLYIYVQILIFLLLLSKVDSSHLDSLIWNIVPFYIFGLLFVYVSKFSLISKKEN